MFNNIRLFSNLSQFFKPSYRFARHHKEIVWKKDFLQELPAKPHIIFSPVENDIQPQIQPDIIKPSINQAVRDNSDIQKIVQPIKIEKLKDSTRLTKYLSNTGICSRRQAEKLIEQGMIYVDKKLVTQNIQVNQNNAIQVFTKQGEKKVWLFYKPVGLICSHEDPQGRPTVYDFVKKELKITSHIISVGRLDFNSEGLLIVTNDGSIARVMELPASQIEREYRVRVFGRFDEDKLRKIQKGAMIAGVQYGPFFCRVERRQTKNTWLIIKMETGKNREIRKVMQKFQLQVNRIIRTRFGPYSLGDMKPGQLFETDIDPAIKRKLYLMLRKDVQSQQQQQQQLSAAPSQTVGISNQAQGMITEQKQRFISRR